MTSSPARTDVLARIRQALGERTFPREDDYRAVPRAYRQAPSLGPAECVALFADRLVHYDASVYRCDRAGLPSTIGEALSARHKQRVVVPSDLPREWRPDGVDVVEDDGLTYSELDRADAVLTGCTVAIAVTGTIVLRHAAAEGRRALSLIPDHHLCVVGVDQIVETVPEAFRRIRALHPALLTAISGPSATADIEMTRIRGVHGPRTLDVILAD